MGLIDSFLKKSGLKKHDILIQLAGDMKLTYFPGREDSPAYVTGTYSGRGITLDRLNEKGYPDFWHPHGRIIVSLNHSRRETHIIAKKNSFYSRKLGEVEVENNAFNEMYHLLSSNPILAKKIFTPEVTSWIVKLELPLEVSGSSIKYHQDKEFTDVARIKHAVDALVYIANLHDRIGISM
jgi:hypothetical protein